MLGDGRIPDPEILRKLSNRLLAIDELAQDQETMPVGKRLQQFAGIVGGGFHDLKIDFHYCESTQI